MKVSWVLWWICNAFWFVVFSLGSLFVWLREIDGAGAIQTPEVKLISFAVLLVAFIFPALVQVVWLIINLVIKSSKKIHVQ